MNHRSTRNDKAAIETIAGHFAGSRWLQGYARGKLRTDPVYRAVLDLLRERPQPVLDLGCGIGLLSFYLREHGFEEPILGVDRDEKKIAQAAAIAAGHYTGLRFEFRDARDVPLICDTVVLLDVLHYLKPSCQRSLLKALAEKIPPGGVVIIRNTPRDGSWRYLMTRLEEMMIRLFGWVRGSGGGLHFPTVEEVAMPFRGRGFSEETRPLWGRTPFNSYLFVFTRPPSDDSSSGRGERGG